MFGSDFGTVKWNGMVKKIIDTYETNVKVWSKCFLKCL